MSTYQHGWFKALVWVLFWVMAVFLFPGMAAVWFWRLSYRPPPRSGRRVSMLILVVLAGLFQVMWLNALIIDPMAGIGEALDPPPEQIAAEATPAETDPPPPAEARSPTTAAEAETEEEDAAAPTAATTAPPEPDTVPADGTEAAPATTAAAASGPTTTEAAPATTTTTTTAPAPTTTATTAAPATTTTTAPAGNQTTSGASGALTGLAVAAEGSGGVAYDRDLYGSWRQVSSGCNTRCMVLEEERQSDGTWFSWYDGTVVSNSSQLDIDHMVPLAEAHSSGAWQWSSSRKRNFANDLSHSAALTAVSASSNRSKGARDPAEWRPTNRSAWCQYATDWVTVKIAWGLSADRAEVAALREMLDTCGSGVTITTVPGAAPPARATTTTIAAASTAAAAAGSCSYTSAAGDPCAALPALGNRSNDVNCGDVPSRFKPLTVVGQDYDRLDGNNDGVACTS